MPGQVTFTVTELEVVFFVLLFFWRDVSVQVLPFVVARRRPDEIRHPVPFTLHVAR